jgi:hypothetical protein
MGCVDCGIKDYRVLEFDHIKEKFAEVSYLVAHRMSMKKIREEIAKCVIRCANCHRIQTYKRRTR